MPRNLLLIFSILLVCACSPKIFGLNSKMPLRASVPIPAPYPVNEQYTMQAMHHWQVLAAKVAKEIDARLGDNELISQQGIYIASAGITPFKKTFKDFLRTALFNHGLHVTNSQNGAALLEFDLQAAHKNMNIYYSAPPEGSYQPQYNIVAEDQISSKIYYPSTAKYILKKIPHNEIAVNISILFQDKYLYRKSDIYYIHSNQVSNYIESDLLTENNIKTYNMVDN